MIKKANDLEEQKKEWYDTYMKCKEVHYRNIGSNPLICPVCRERLTFDREVSDSPDYVDKVDAVEIWSCNKCDIDYAKKPWVCNIDEY